MNFESLRMALGGIIANKMRSALTMLGIMIGVASVVILVAVGAGSAEKSRKQLESLGSNTLIVIPGGLQLPGLSSSKSRKVEILDSDVAALNDNEQAPDISDVTPSVSANAKLALDGVSVSPAQIAGTVANYADVKNQPVEFGSFFTDDDVESHRKVVVVGTTTAKNLLGENADLSTLVGRTVKLGPAKFTVVGVFKSKGSNGFQDQDDTVVLPITSARDTIAGGSKSVSGLTIRATSRETTDAAQAQTQAVLTSRHRGTTNSDFFVLNQASIQATQDASNKTFTTLLGAVAAISLLVGGIGVMNIMLVTVTERTREIGIRKAIGARRVHIVSQFLTEAVVLSMLGGLLGVVAGIIGSKFRIVGTTPLVQTYSIFLAFGVAVVTGLFFGLFPANRASKLRPIDALRHE
jgi:putative ABC transport system permease protein